MNAKKTNRRWIRWSLLLVSLLLLGWLALQGVERASNFRLGNELRPQVDSAYVEIDSLQPHLVNAWLYISIYNFLPFNVTLDSLDYTLMIDDSVYVYKVLRQERLLRRGKRHGGKLPLTVDLRQLKQEIKEEDQAGLAIELNAYIDFPIIGQKVLTWDQAKNLRQSKSPTVNVNTIHAVLSGQGEKEASIDFELNIDRNFPRGSYIDSIHYTIRIGGEKYIVGHKEQDIALHQEKGDEPILLPARIRFTELRNRLRSVQGRDSMWVSTKGYVAIRIPPRQRFKLRFALDRRLMVPKVPEITIKEVRLNNFDIDTSQLLVVLEVVNYNPFGLTFHSIDYEFYIGKKKIAMDRYTSMQRVDSNSTSLVHIPVKVKAYQAGWKALSILLFKSQPKYTLRGTFEITSDIKEIGTIDLNLTGHGHIKTDELSGKGEPAVRFGDVIKELDQR